MTTKEQAAESLIRSTAALGSLAGHILKERPTNSRGGVSKTKASRKAARRARRTPRRG
ncbi:hypothetical protein KW849_14450 [Pseudomonas sp. PDM26]|uniref:hypothetical protein n=1 Tax=Pseudomonas TaxID=286 RepID=UPI001C45BC63|nr:MULTISPECIES: hypothetical protein [Pseudomonas]MBV7547489.1 hypothetical protein [Pseudomonas sp. PDM26]MCT9825969.1 hypothetical protein [Pseudomonas veronii]